MNFFSKISSLFKVRRSLKINTTPLYFSEEAVFQINSYLVKRPAHIKSAFKISIAYQKESILCQVGFDDYKTIRKTLFDYPVPLIISEVDELFLRGSYIDFHKEEEAYFYYPNVHLEVTDRSKGEIFVFTVDRKVISEDSPIQNYALDKEHFIDSSPFLIKQIFESNMVESLYLESNILSIEKSKGIDKTIFEEEMAELILSYFEKCGYPLVITGTAVEEKKYAV